MTDKRKKVVDLNDPQVVADIARAVKAAELADICPPGQKKRRSKCVKSREGYKRKGDTDRLETDPRGGSTLDPHDPAGREIKRLVMGHLMMPSRAQAVNRVTRRVMALLGPDSPPKNVLRWWVAEMISNLSCPNGIVRVGVLRIVGEAIGLLRPGTGGMPSNVSRASSTWVPKVTFSAIPLRDRLAQKHEVKKLALKPKLSDQIQILPEYAPHFPELPKEDPPAIAEQA